MTIKKAKSFNHQVYEKSYKRLNLSSSQRIIFQRLLGFLIRNNRPFPYSAVRMAELTGFDKRTIFRGLNRLEHLRLIKKIGLGKNRRFYRGSMLDKIITTVTNRSNPLLVKNNSTATLCHQNSTNRDIVSPNKTSSSSNRNNKGVISQSDLQEREYYLKNPKVKVKEEHKWLLESPFPVFQEVEELNTQQKRGMEKTYFREERKRNYLNSKGPETVGNILQKFKIPTS